MSSFTPGPWHARRMKCQTEKHTYNSEVIAADGSEVTTILKEQDARLIAAAPDMLQALYECIAWFEDNEIDCIALDEARAAIAKAKGEQ